MSNGKDKRYPNVREKRKTVISQSRAKKSSQLLLVRIVGTMYKVILVNLLIFFAPINARAKRQCFKQYRSRMLISMHQPMIDYNGPRTESTQAVSGYQISPATVGFILVGLAGAFWLDSHLH